SKNHFICRSINDHWPHKVIPCKLCCKDYQRYNAWFYKRKHDFSKNLITAASIQNCSFFKFFRKRHEELSQKECTKCTEQVRKHQCRQCIKQSQFLHNQILRNQEDLSRNHKY